jgi:hypothetical protein
MNVRHLPVFFNFHCFSLISLSNLLPLGFIQALFSRESFKNTKPEGGEEYVIAGWKPQVEASFSVLIWLYMEFV